MADYSGEIRINTKIDTEQAKAGAADLNKAFENIASTLEKLGEPIQAALNSIGESIDFVKDFMVGFAEGFSESLEGIETTNVELERTTSITEEATERASKLSDVFKSFGTSTWRDIKNIGSHMAKMMGSAKKTADHSKNIMTNFVKAAIGVRGLQAALNKIKSSMQYGSKNLAGWSDTYNKSISDIMNGMNQLKNNITAAFSPLVETIAPIISNFIDLLNTAVNKVGMFFAALTGKDTYTKAIKQTEQYVKSQEKANKVMQNGLNALEELNVIGKDEGIDADQVAAAVQGGLFETANIDNSVKKYLEEIKKAFKNGDFTEIGFNIGAKLKKTLDNIPWDDIRATGEKLASSAATFLNGVVDSGVIGTLGTTLAEGLNTVVNTVDTFVTTFEWKNAGEEIGNAVNNFFETTNWTKLGNATSNLAIGILDWITAALDTIKWNKVGWAIRDYFKGIDFLTIFGKSTTLLVKVGNALYELFTGEEVTMSVEEAMEEIARSLEDGSWVGAFKQWGIDIANAIIEGMGDLAVWIAQKVAKPLTDVWNMVHDMNPTSYGSAVNRGGDPMSALIENYSKWLPHHATGTVIPRTAEPYMAVLGDNKRETEIVSPLSTMQQAMENALANTGGFNDRPLDIQLKIDGDKLFRWIVEKNRDERINKSRNPMFG